jgi:ADP-ribose pyrophosphatase
MKADSRTNTGSGPQPAERFHDFIGENPGWELLEKQIALATPYLQVHLVRLKTPTRPDGVSWNVVHRKGAAVVAPRTRDGRWVLVRQERVPIRAAIWEFPAGQIDDAEGDLSARIEATAGRELEEEAGYRLASGGQFRHLGHFFPSAGFTDEHSHLLLADPVEPKGEGNRPDPHEAILGCREFSGEELRAMIASGEIRDANTLAMFARLCATGCI